MVVGGQKSLQGSSAGHACLPPASSNGGQPNACTEAVPLDDRQDQNRKLKDAAQLSEAATAASTSPSRGAAGPCDR